MTYVLSEIVPTLNSEHYPLTYFASKDFGRSIYNSQRALSDLRNLPKGTQIDTHDFSNILSTIFSPLTLPLSLQDAQTCLRESLPPSNSIKYLRTWMTIEHSAHNMLRNKRFWSNARSLAEEIIAPLFERYLVGIGQTTQPKTEDSQYLLAKSRLGRYSTQATKISKDGLIAVYSKQFEPEAEIHFGVTLSDLTSLISSAQFCAHFLKRLQPKATLTEHYLKKFAFHLESRHESVDIPASSSQFRIARVISNGNDLETALDTISNGQNESLIYTNKREQELASLITDSFALLEVASKYLFLYSRLSTHSQSVSFYLKTILQLGRPPARLPVVDLLESSFEETLREFPLKAVHSRDRINIEQILEHLNTQKDTALKIADRMGYIPESSSVNFMPNRPK
jgi:hypothetical protein